MTAVVRLGLDDRGQAVHIDDEALKRHIFVLGATGSGKTNLLCSMAGDAIGAGRGLIFIDGKGDRSAYRQIRKMARDAGREDDVLLLDMSLPGKRGGVSSNTINPFAKTGASSIIQLIVGMMSPPSGDGIFWHDRAIALVSCVVRALHFLRETGRMDLSPVHVRENLSLTKIIDLADPEIHPDMPHAVRNSLKTYLESLPSFQWARRHKQAVTTTDQHGYLHMQLTRLLSGLIDDYGHAISDGRGEIDLDDIRDNSKILVVLIPTLGKSARETSFVAQVILCLLQEMIAEGMDSVPRSEPFMVFLDEFGSYATGGIEAMAAQGRSLGYSFVFSMQALIDARGDHEGRVLDAVLSNTGTKLLMRTGRVDMARLAQVAPALVEKPIEAARSRLRQRMADAREMIFMQRETGLDEEIVALIRKNYASDAAELMAMSATEDPSQQDLTALMPGKMLVAEGLRPLTAVDLGPFPTCTSLNGPVTSSVMTLHAFQKAVSDGSPAMPACLVAKIRDGLTPEDVARITFEALLEMAPA
ncbi:helicase HerA domain-containing protein [Bosea sp. RAC05]|uniref:helicase HerA domain-containing protein n=1 Tax=Bosea sp. RAC05 TaxID=1842539 RepID=UPI00083E34AC|nr:DUF87 domain-containing protein [Bosea sp. RAC05]AOG02971.1 ftsK/SpoIIIE family protein [Bosea sp. RAC05]